MVYSPILTSIELKKRPVLRFDQEGWSWVTLLVDELDFSCFPTKRANSFILLQSFKGGADGRVWIACSTSGKICVLKFIIIIVLLKILKMLSIFGIAYGTKELELLF